MIEREEAKGKPRASRFFLLPLPLLLLPALRARRVDRLRLALLHPTFPSAVPRVRASIALS